ncbi:ImpA family type VI secretion-associated protein [Klebsiella michiganensis]|nr:ImpA family type VI secretion-associated protein [Klebsiella michiganensis]
MASVKNAGAGFELRTDEHGAVRAAKGLFLTADAQAKAQGPVIEMAPAINQINQANSQNAGPEQRC